MPEVAVSIEGLRELQRNVDKLSRSFAQSTLRTALRNAASPVRKTAREIIRAEAEETGELRRGIATNAKVTRSGEGYADVGVRRNSPARSRLHFIETGTSQRAAVAPLRRSLETNQRNDTINDAFITALNKTIEKQVGRIRGS